MLRYRRETALQGASVLAKSEKTGGTERQYYTNIIGPSSTVQPLWYNRSAKLSNSVK